MPQVLVQYVCLFEHREFFVTLHHPCHVNAINTRNAVLSECDRKRERENERENEKERSGRRRKEEEEEEEAEKNRRSNNRKGAGKVANQSDKSEEL